jgi:hypothetical protein
VEARLFGKDRSGRVVQGPLADTLSRYVGRPVRLVLADTAGVGWDEGPVSLVSRASADALRPPGDATSRSRRFRMLIEVDGVDAHGEDAWVGHRVRIGGAVIGVTHTLYRCVVINQDPDDPHEVWPGLHKLAEHRAGGRLTLGVIADVDAPGSICVGDTVEVLSTYTRDGAQTA